MSEFETDVLVQLVGRKYQILAELCELGRRQAALIDREDMVELLNVLSTKQQLISALQATERQLDPFRGQRPEQRRWRTPAERARCAQLLDACEALLAETVQQEKRSEGQLRLRRDEAAARLEGAHAAGVARNAYAAHNYDSLTQLDLSSED